MDKIEHIAMNRLIPYARNARTHSDTQVAQIAASIREFGFCNPVLIDEHDGIIAGHGRVLAGRKLGLTEIPCIRLSHLTETQRRAYIIADNKLALNAEWDMDLLALEMEDLKGMDFDLELTGFNADELAGIALGEEGGADGSPDRLTMAERFGIPPFSVLNAREGWWQARKQAWMAMGIQSELGRGENLTNPQGDTDGGGGLIIDEYHRISRGGGLTWTSLEVSEKGLNFYRNRTPRREAP